MRRIVLCSLMLIVCTTAVTAQVKISQIYGGGANQGAPLTRDYVELYNTTAAPVTMTNWSLQYAAAAGTFATTQSAVLNGTIPANGYWLVGLQNNSTATTAANAPGIPTPDTNGLNSLGNQIDVAATSGKFMLRSTSAAFTTALGQPTTTLVPDLVDFVGFGTAASSANWNEPATTGAANTSANNTPPPSATLAIYRNNCGSADSDNNRTDWNAGAPSPRNSTTLPNLGLSMIGSAIPWSVRQGDTTNLRCTPRLCGSNTLNPGTLATANLSSLTGGAPTLMHDDGLLGDDLAGDGLYMLDVVIPAAQAPGQYDFPILLADGSGNSGGGFISIVVLPSSAPANDNCRTATPIVGPYNPPVSMGGNLTGANVESNPVFTSPSPMTTAHAARRGLWYSVTGTGTTLTADLCSTTTSFDSVMMVFCGNCDGLTIVEVADNFCNCNATTTLSKLSFCSQFGVTYYIWVAHATGGAQTNAFTLRITDAGMPCTATTNCTNCVLAAAVPQTEAEAGYGPATNDGCDVQATLVYPGTFTDIPVPGTSPLVVRGTSRGMGGNRDADWYRFQATASGQLTASILGQRLGYQIALESLSATGGCPAVVLAASNLSGPCNSATMLGTVTAGTWYALRVINIGTAGSVDYGQVALATFFGGEMPAAATYNYTMTVEIAGQPLYDTCATPAWVPPFGTPGAAGAVALGLVGDNTLATLDGPATACGVAVDKDCWFKFRPGYATPAWTMHTCSASTTFDTVLEVYNGCGGALLACNDDDVGCGTGLQSRLDVSLTAGNEYWIRVCAKGNPAPGGTFALIVVPGNDIVNRNVALYQIPGGGGSVSGSTTFMSTELLAGAQGGTSGTTTIMPSCSASVVAGQRDQYFYFTPTDPCATGWTFSTCCGSEITQDTEVIVSALPPTGATNNSVACGDDACVSPSYTLNTFGTTGALVTGTPYFVRVLGWSTTAVGPFTLNVTPIGPVNDLCANAPTVTLPASLSSSFSPTCTTNDGTSICDPTGRDLWWKFTTTATGAIHIDTCGSAVDTVVSLYSGACGSLALVACNDDGTLCLCGAPAAVLDVPSIVAGTYYVRVSDKLGPGGNFNLNIRVPGPANDECCTAIPVVTGANGPFSSVGASNSFGVAGSCTTGFNDVWFSYFNQCAGNLTVTTCGSTIDTVLTAYAACGGPELACNDDSTCPVGTLQSIITFPVTANTTYLIRGASFSATVTGSFPINITSSGLLTFYQDVDGDGFGNPAVTVQDCTQPPGYVANNGDCNDGNPAINPSAQEVCDGVDNDCDNLIDDADPSVTGGSTFYQDADGDGYGNPAATQIKCVQPLGYVSNSLDCNDANSAVHPGAVEICNGIDDDCDLLTDDADPGVTGQPTWYQDSDGDGYGNPAVTQVACAQPAGYVANNGDCNDTNAAVNPGATEICNNIDDDCDSIIDEVCPTNDHCTTPTVIGDGTTLGDNSVAGSEIADVTCGLVNHDIWYSYTNPLSCTWSVTASMCPADGGGASFDAVLHVFSPPCGALGLIACNNDTCGTNPKVTFTLAGGATALIAVSGVAPGPGGLFGMVLSHTSATMSQIGPGCSDGGGPGPTLTLSGLPVLCAPRVLNITGAQPRSAGMLMFSFPGTTTILTGSCPLYLNNGSMTFLFFIGTDASGNWGAGVTVPCDPSLECATFHVQGFLFPNNPPPFYQVTSGLSVTLGL